MAAQRTTSSPSHPHPTAAAERVRATRRSAHRRWYLAAGALLAVGAIFAISVLTGATKDAPISTERQTRPVAVTGTKLPDFTATDGDTAPGMVIPTLQGSDFAGNPITIGADGTPKVIIFLAHWCPHCQAEVPVLTKWLAANGAPNGVRFYAVSTSVDATLPNYPPSSWLQREHWPLLTMADDSASSAGKAFGITHFPAMVFVNAAGKVMVRTAGELPAATVQAQAQALLG